MLFLSKFIASWLLPPGIFILILFGIGVYLWKCRHGDVLVKRVALMFGGLGLVFYLFSLEIVADILLRNLEYKYKPIHVQADAIVLLGGGLIDNTCGVSTNATLSGGSANRFLTSLELCRETGAPIIVSGGNLFGEKFTEPQLDAHLAEKLGFGRESVIIDEFSRNTEENAISTLKICRERGFKKIYVVTSAFHMPRAMLQMEKYYAGSGIELFPFPCDYLTGRSNGLIQRVLWYSICPSAHAFWESAVVLHEYLGMLYFEITND